MTVIKRGRNTFLVRVYMGRDPLTKKRIEVNETVRGTRTSAKKMEAKLKGDKEAGRINGPGRMTLNGLLDDYSNSVRHVQEEGTREKDRAYLDYYVRPYIGSLPLKKINRGTIQELFNHLLDKREVAE